MGLTQHCPQISDFNIFGSYDITPIPTTHTPPPRGNTGSGHQHRPQSQQDRRPRHGPWTPTWSQMADQTPGTCMVLSNNVGPGTSPQPPSCCRVTYPDMALGTFPGLNDIMDPGDSAGHSDEHGPSGSTFPERLQDQRLWPRPQASLCPLVATWTMDINADPDYGRTKSPDMVLGSSPDPDVTMASGGLAGHSDWHGPHGSNLPPGGSLDHSLLCSHQW